MKQRRVLSCQALRQRRPGATKSTSILCKSSAGYSHSRKTKSMTFCRTIRPLHRHLGPCLMRRRQPRRRSKSTTIIRCSLQLLIWVTYRCQRAVMRHLCLPLSLWAILQHQMTCWKSLKRMGRQATKVNQLLYSLHLQCRYRPSTQNTPSRNISKSTATISNSLLPKTQCWPIRQLCL